MNHGKYIIGIRLLLLKEYLQANSGPKRPIKRKDIEKYLTEKGFPVEKKTLYADFAVLGQVFGLRPEYDKHSKGWKLLNPPFEPYELRLLVDGIQSSSSSPEKRQGRSQRRLKPLPARKPKRP